MHFLRSSLLSALFAVAALAGAARGQVTQIPGTGCPNAPYPTTAGSPAIGQTFGVIAAPCQSRMGQQFLVLGAPGLGAVLPVPPACGPRCVLECRPVVILAQAGFRVTIPNDPNLVGAAVCNQSGCVEAGRPPCVSLHGALGVRITR
jgi:hypothetical protein